MTAPRPGDGVLVRDCEGKHYFREFRAGRAATWPAYPYDAIYPTLQSNEDGLEVVAVLTAQPTRSACEKTRDVETIK